MIMPGPARSIASAAVAISLAAGDDLAGPDATGAVDAAVAAVAMTGEVVSAGLISRRIRPRFSPSVTDGPKMGPGRHGVN